MGSHIDYQTETASINDPVYDHPEFTPPAGGEREAVEAGNLVRNDGTLFYPYIDIGRVKVSGMMLGDVRSMMTRRVSQYLMDPHLDVKVAAFHPKYIYMCLVKLAHQASCRSRLNLLRYWMR
ncbi:polysaccharide biosynthesis/export family protein [Cobetia sp. QF-1]|uniref:polysaccharide biosynthesis/export family protein n=1 Tax=Cobetia sp. QF-1 TaxID=1969833 RepID=UPI000B53F262